MLHKATMDQKRQPSNHTEILHQSTIMIIKINCASFFRKTATTKTKKQLSRFFRKTNRASRDRLPSSFRKHKKKGRPDRQARCKCVFLRRKAGGRGGGGVGCSFLSHESKKLPLRKVESGKTDSYAQTFTKSVHADRRETA